MCVCTKHFHRTQSATKSVHALLCSVVLHVSMCVSLCVQTPPDPRLGDFACCIFSLLPTARMYPASGINANLQWCGIGFTQLPNGLGFGGQVGHYGLYIDSTMDGGMSRPSATFAR